MRISDWSSDVCSSDLVIRASPSSFRVAWTERRYQDGSLAGTERWTAILTVAVQPPRAAERLRKNPLGIFVDAINRSEERRVGKECVSTCRSWWSRYHQKNTH